MGYLINLLLHLQDLKGIKEEDLKQMKVDYIRMVLGDCIIDNEDRRLKNIETFFSKIIV